MKSWLIKLIVFGLLVFGLSWIPLIGAYDYEASLCVALVGLIAVPVLAPKSGTGHFLARTLSGTVIYWIMANAATAATALLRSEMCDFIQGVEYQLLIAFPAVILAALVWSWICRISRYGFLQKLLYLCALGLDFGFALYALYNWPPLVAFGQFFGYFAGSIYDESIDVIHALMLWRFGTAILCLCLFAAQTAKAGVLRRFALPATGILIALSYHCWLSENGDIIPMGRSSIEQALWQTVQAPDGSFTVHYVPKSKSRRELNAENYRVLAEFTRDYRYLEDFFKTRPRAPIDIWLYPNREIKGKYIGAKNTSFARVWKNEIHLVATSPDSTLARHEMAHLFAGSFGHEPLMLAGGWHIPALGWIEGLAMSAEWPVQTYNLHTWSAAILANENTYSRVSAHTLLYGFWGLPSRVAYTLAGSWVHWLIEQYGIETVKQLSRGMPGDFDNLTGKSFLENFKQWKIDLRRNHSNRHATQIAALTFGSTSIWTKHCARSQAALNAEWYRCLDDEFCSLEAIEPSMELCSTTCDRGMHSPNLQDLEKLYQYYWMRGVLDDGTRVPESLRLLSHSSINALHHSFHAAWQQIASTTTPEHLSDYTSGELRSLIFSLYNGLDASAIPLPARIIWQERRADMMWQAGMYSIAQIMYQNMLRQPMTKAMERRIDIKQQAAKYPESPVSQAVRFWMNTSDAAQYERIALEHRGAPIISYLDFVHAVHQRQYPRAHRALYRIFTTTTVQDPAKRLNILEYQEIMRLIPYL